MVKKKECAMKYKVNWNYKSSLGGPFLKGDVVPLDEARAEDINRDSPGVLTPVKDKTPEKHDRMQAEAEFQRKTEAAKLVQEPIDKDTFKAVKG